MQKAIFSFSEVGLFHVRWSNCYLYNGEKLQGKGTSMHSWTSLSGGEGFITSITCNRDSWVLVWCWKRQNDTFSASASASWGFANARLWLSVMSLQISSDGDWWVARWLVISRSGGHGHILSEQGGIRVTPPHLYEPVPRHSRYRENRICGPCYAAPLLGQCLSYPEQCSLQSRCALGRLLLLMDWHRSLSRTGPAKVLVLTKQTGLGRVQHWLSEHIGGLYLNESCPLRTASSSQFLLSRRNKAGETWKHSLQGHSAGSRRLQMARESLALL